jgi:formamidopyrimidine-DNA glycosylase
MPELPDVTVYVEHLRSRLIGATLDRLAIASPNLLRSVEPPVEDVLGRAVDDVRRMGKRIVFAFAGDRFVIVHLMIAGRFRWRAPGAKVPGRVGLAAFSFSTGTLLLTEASTRHRASLHVVAGAAALAALDPGGLDVLTASGEAFAGRLRSEDHTLKRALTDARLFDGIGNAYSDEILHRARLSPLRRSVQLSPEEIVRLQTAARTVLDEWTDRLRREAADAFPEKVTAFHAGMAVHGRYREPCPVCGAPVQRIVYVENEANYCARCQTGGRLLADRALSRLLKGDWPKRIEDLER